MVRNIFAGKSPRIVRVLLSNPSKTWRLRELATEANVSLGLASIVTNRLIDMGFLIRDRSMRLKLRKEEELLKRWGAVYDSSTWIAQSVLCTRHVVRYRTEFSRNCKKTLYKVRIYWSIRHRPYHPVHQTCRDTHVRYQRKRNEKNS